MAFLDLDADGVRGADAVLEHGVGDVPVWLFSCDDPGDVVFPLLQTTKTDGGEGGGGGYYSFGSLHVGDGRSYYVNVQPPSWYAITPAWEGGGVAGVDAGDDVDVIVSAVNPSTGNTPCFELTTYATIVNFGLVFDVAMQPTTDPASGVPPTDAPASPPPPSPSKGPSASPVEEDVDVVADVEPPAPPTAGPTTSGTSSAGFSPPPSAVAMTSSGPAAAAPSSPPGGGGGVVEGGWYGPLAMTLRGVDDIEDRGAWREATAAHVEKFFNDGGGGGGSSSGVLSDLTVDILIYQVDRRSRGRWRRALRGGSKTRGRRRRRDEADDDGGGESYAQVVYRQRSSYRTTDPQTYDEAYVAMEPFLSREDRASYILSLRDLSSHYDPVKSVGVRLAPPPDELAAVAEEVEVENGGGGDGDDDGGMSRSTIYAIVGSACGGAVLIAALALLAYRRGRNSDKEYMSSVGNGPASSMRRFDGDDAGGSDVDLVSSTVRRADVESPGTKGTSGYLDDLTLIPTSLSSSSPRGVGTGPPAATNVLLDVIVPPGKLGIVVETPPQGGCAYVCKIKDSCPVRDDVRLEDRIIAVDDEDVQTMNAVKLSKMLARRSGNAVRKITVLRVVTAESGAGMAGGEDFGEWRGLGAVPSSPTTGATAPPVVSLLDNPAVDGCAAVAATGNATAGGAVIDIVAPPGKLGVVLVSPVPPEPPGSAFVYNVRADSPIAGRVELGDRILAVDGVDVRGMSAEDVSKLLGSKNTKSRRITLLREVGAGAGTVGESTGDTSPSPAADDKCRRSATTKSNAADSTVAMRAEIVTLCAALQFPRSTEEMLSSYEGMEHELLKNLRKMKAKSDRDMAAGKKNKGKVLADSDYSDTTSGLAAGTRINIVAPPGKLGLVVDTPPDGGLPYVSDVKDYCPIRGQIRLGDRLVEVDSEDVTKLKGIHISMILGSKNMNSQRHITVLREGG